MRQLRKWFNSMDGMDGLACLYAVVMLLIAFVLVIIRVYVILDMLSGAHGDSPITPQTAVAILADEGIIIGVEDISGLGYDFPVTRGSAAMLMERCYRGADFRPEPVPVPSPDHPYAHWATPWLAQATHDGFMEPVAMVAADMPIVRADLAVILVLCEDPVR